MSIAHSPLGASIAKRWMACPGSVAAAAALPSPPSSPDSELGTAAHALAEKCLRDITNAGFLIGAQFEGRTVDEEMAAAVQVYLDVVRHWHERLPRGRMFIEERVDLSWIHPSMFGTADAMIVEPWDEAVVIDYKHGAGIAVDVEDNPQLAYYALGPYFAYDCKKVTCVIVQPRCAHPDGPIRSVTYSRDQLGEWADRFRDAAEKATQRNAKRAAGDHCRFCPAAATCDALHRHAVTVAQAEFAPAITPPAPHTLTPDQVALVLDHADTIEAWIDAVRKHALARAQGGLPVPGYKLVEGRRGARKWVDEAKAAEALTALGVDPFERSVLSPAALEKRLGKTAKPTLAKVLDLIAQAPGSPQLVPDADRRVPLIPSALSDFSTPAA